MYQRSEQREWELYLQELKKINIEDVRRYLVEHGWQPRKSQYEPRAQVLVHSEGYVILLPIDPKLSDFYQRLADALRIMALAENVWYPRLVERLIKISHG